MVNNTYPILDNLIGLYDPNNAKVYQYPWHGMDSANLQTGSNFQYITILDLRTGVNANSSARVSSGLFGLNFDQAGSIYAVDWDKKITMMFSIARTTAEAEAQMHVGLRENTNIGDIAAKGFGIVIDNLDMKGETYDTLRAEVDFSLTMTTNRIYAVKIVHDPAHGQIEWFVDGVSKGISTREPTTIADQLSYLFANIQNGGTGGTDARGYVGPVWLIMEK